MENFSLYGVFLPAQLPKPGHCSIPPVLTPLSLTFLAVQHGILQGAGSPGLALHWALCRADAAAPVCLVFAPHFFLPKRGLGGRDLLRAGDVAAGHSHLSRTGLLKRMGETAGLEGSVPAPHPRSPLGCPQMGSHTAMSPDVYYDGTGMGLLSHLPQPHSQGDKLTDGNTAETMVRTSLAKGTITALMAMEETSLAMPPQEGLLKPAAPLHASSWEKIQSKGEPTNEGDLWLDAAAAEGLSGFGFG